MRDRPARLDDRVAGRALEVPPLPDLLAAPRRSDNRDVRRRAVRVDVGETAADATRLAERRARRGRDVAVEAGKPLPRDARLEGVAQDPAAQQSVAEIWHRQERSTPRLDRACARVRRGLVPLTAVLLADREALTQQLGHLD